MIRPSAPAIVAAAALALAACNKATPAPPKPPTAADRLLTIDGIEITFGEVLPLLDFVTATHPEVGRKTLMQMVLETHTVPLRLAERAFAAERAELKQHAADLRSVATNVVELEAQAVPERIKEHKKYSRMQPELPVSMFLFDPLMTGGVSDPIAVQQGFVVTGAHDYAEMPLRSEDMVEATQVGFFTHTYGAWRDWLATEQQRVADKVTYVHPDYREALPTWCKSP